MGELFTHPLSKYPQSKYAIQIEHFLYPEKRLKWLEEQKKEDYKQKQWQRLHYLKAELNYKLNRKRKAKKFFIEYVENCQNNKYKDCDLLDEAKEYISIINY